MTLRTAHTTLNSESAKVRYEVASLLILVSFKRFDFLSSLIFMWVGRKVCILRFMKCLLHFIFGLHVSKVLQ